MKRMLLGLTTLLASHVGQAFTFVTTDSTLQGWAQKPVLARGWRFESSSGHQRKILTKQKDARSPKAPRILTPFSNSRFLHHLCITRCVSTGLSRLWP